MRPSNRTPAQTRPITITRSFTAHAEGSVLVEFGDTKVLCTASFTEGVPRFLKGQGQGWVTAEYGMLPRSTHSRMDREAARGKQSGRTQEIQRLIGRALRAAVDMKLLGENTIVIDCDVIQADGGTRTAAITGACVALVDALNWARGKGIIKANPLKFLIAAVNYYQVNIPIPDNQDMTDILIAQLAEVGFESFEENEEFVIAYIPEKDYLPELLASIDYCIAPKQ